jgi:hypothetical protein
MIPDLHLAYRYRIICVSDDLNCGQAVLPLHVLIADQ